MTDRDLFRRAVGGLPSLAPPLLGTYLVGWLMADFLPRTLFSVTFEKMEDIEKGMVPLFAFLGLWTLLGGVVDFLRLGIYRLCLDRGEGKLGTMPWTILHQWRRYIGWALWTAGLSVFWRLKDRLLLVWLGHRMTDMEFAEWNLWRSYGHIAEVLMSLLLGSLLRLAIQTAYLRSPERGFWRSVGFGVREGLKKWPRTIGAQLKFVVPVSLGTRFVNLLLSKLAFRIGGPGASHACNLTASLVNLLAQTWIMVLYGVLAAERYDGPEERM